MDTIDRPIALTRFRGSLAAASLGLVVLGVGLLIVSFTDAAWLRFPIQMPGSRPTTAQLTFADIHNPRARLPLHPALMTAYFSWLAWALLAVAVLAALLGYGPLRRVLVVRVAALVTALFGLAVTMKVISELQLTSRTGWRQFAHVSSTGVWFAVSGFALVSLGALVALGRRDNPLNQANT